MKSTKTSYFRISGLDPDTLRKLTTLTLATAFAGQFFAMPCLAAQTPKKTFQLRAGQDFIKPEDSPSLSRSDMNRAGDPFDSSGSGQEDTFQPPPNAFQVQTSRTGMPDQRTFPMSAEESGDFNGQGMPGMGDQMPPQQQPRQAMLPPQMQPPMQMNQMRQNPHDPDGESMRLAWDEWHRRVAECIFNQISTYAKTFLKNSKPLVCVISYTVTRDGRVVNVHMQQNSSSLVYNGMVYATVSRMAGNPVLAFPQGSKRLTVEKLSTFGHNNGGPQGFRSIVGDQETVKGR